MDTLFKDISATTVLLIFLFFCGTLYIISYWSTFNFDITNYIELFDIPKSFVFPLATGMGVSLLSLLAQTIVQDSPVTTKIEVPTEKGLNRGFAAKLQWINIDIVTLISLLTYIVFYKTGREWVIIFLGLTLSFWGFRKLHTSTTAIKLLPNKRLRLFLSVMFSFIPVYSFGKGKLDGIDVWKNRTYYSIVKLVYTDPSITPQAAVGSKLLGKLGSCLIVTDSLNNNITVIGLEKVQLVQYQLHKGDAESR